MEDLFSSNKKDFRFVRLNERDAKNLSDHLSYFKDLVSANEEMYPGIDKWVDHKVIPGLKSSERVAFVGYLEENPVISAVVKRANIRNSVTLESVTICKTCILENYSFH